LSQIIPDSSIDPEVKFKRRSSDDLIVFKAHEFEKCRIYIDVFPIIDAADDNAIEAGLKDRP